MQLTKENFWDTDLSDIESIFLKKNTKITDLNVYTDNRVPLQGSVLLNNTVNIDKVIKPLTFLQKIKFYLKS